jgi:hypothetical protein
LPCHERIGEKLGAMHLLQRSILLSLIGVTAVCPLVAASAADKSKPGSAAHAEAMKRYPDLAQQDSVFHQAYLTKVEKYRRESPSVLEQPGWELSIAEEVAAGLTTKATEALKIAQVPEAAGEGKNLRIQVRNLGTSREVDAQIKVSYVDGSEAVEKHRLAPGAQVAYPSDASGATEGKRVNKVEIVSASFVQKPAPPPPAAAEKPKAKDRKGIPVAGKPGFIKSPFSPDAGFIDVRGFPPGTEVQDPFSGEKILVP